MSHPKQPTLFRPEVALAQSAQWLGSVRLQRPLSFSVVTSAALGMALLLTGFATLGEVNRKAHLAGLLVPTTGTLTLSAPQSGTVVNLAVVEGQAVQAGDVLLAINAERTSLRNGVTEDATERVAQQIQARQQTLSTERTLRELQARQREAVLRDRIHTQQAELRQAEEECKLQERRVQLAQVTLTRNEQLAKDGFVSVAQVQARQEEQIDARARLQSVQRTHLALQHDLQTLKGELEALTTQLQTDLNQLERNRASLEQEATENTARKSVVVTAPYAGQVTALGLRPGQSVQAGQALLTLLPQATPNTASPAPLQAHLYAPSHTVGFVRPGQSVYLRYAAYPYQKFGLYEGRIASVSGTPFAPNELPPHLAQQLISQAGSSQALYRINVQLADQSVRAYGENIALKPGLALEADVLQERRKIWEWVLEPIFAIRQKMKVLNSAQSSIPEQPSF